MTETDFANLPELEPPPIKDGKVYAPPTPEAVLERLRAGNERASTLPLPPTQALDPDYPLDALGQPTQMPIAVMIGCSDARVPPEILFGVGLNDLFIIRAAGNVLGQEATGSLLYAVQTFAPPKHVLGRSLRAVVVVGHRGCGAVKAALQAHQAGISVSSATGTPIDAILAQIGGQLSIGVRAFEARHGLGSSYRPENLGPLLDLVVFLNTAEIARQAREAIDRWTPSTSAEVAVAYGVLDPLHRHVHARPVPQGTADHVGFAPPPVGREALAPLADELVGLIPLGQ
jgi:carbonic anhydrase